MAQLCIHENTASGRCCATWAFLLGGQAKATCIAEGLTERCSWFVDTLCLEPSSYALLRLLMQLLETNVGFAAPAHLSSHQAAGSHTLVCHCTLLLGCMDHTRACPVQGRSALRGVLQGDIIQTLCVDPNYCSPAKALPGMRPEKGKGCMGGEH